ncbi:MAG TPA: chemotaxis protein CheW [Conexibacter sp.]|jgi:purine-binding chemotaxis protein CheW|nr:chemotaxis protein CheW [Conexibacter sp.]
MTVPDQLVVCALGAEQYGLPIGQVREIVRYVEPRYVAADDDGVRGVIGLRGRLLPVHDLGMRLGLPATAASAVPPATAKIVVVEAGDELAGLLVDDVVEVATITAEQVEEVPAASAGGRAARVAKLGERLVLLVDAAELLDLADAPA